MVYVFNNNNKKRRNEKLFLLYFCFLILNVIYKKTGTIKLVICDNIKIQTIYTDEKIRK